MPKTQVVPPIPPLTDEEVRLLSATRTALGGYLLRRAWSTIAAYEQRLKAVQAERDRLAALAVLQRQAIDHLDLSFERVQDEEVLRLIECVRSDPDGERAAAEAARDSEDARQWREMVAKTDQMLKEWDETDPMTRLAEEVAEEGEELRLLREVERSRNWGEACDASWRALADFRARQRARQSEAAICGAPDSEGRPCLGEGPAAGSIITLTTSVLDERGDPLPVGLDVVVLEVYDDGSILVSADNAAEQDVSAYVHEGEWSQRPEEARRG